MQNTNKYWYSIWLSFAALIAVFSLVFDAYPQFPTMCIILGIVLVVLIDSMEPVPPIHTYHWHQIWDDLRSQKVPIWRGFLFMQSKIIFPTLFTIYLILLIIQKVKIAPPDWQAYAGSAIDTLELFWMTVISATMANFIGLEESTYQMDIHSPIKNTLALMLICLLSYGAMWAIFAEIASMGRVAYFISLSIGILIAIMSTTILSENDEETPLSESSLKAL